MLIARSLANINADGSVVLQVANVGPRPVHLYQNLKLGTFTPRKGIYLVESECESDEGQEPAQVPSFDFSGSNLDTTQQQQLKSLLHEFGDMFTPKLGKTSMVKHAIRTKGPPIRQPIRRLPMSTQGVIEQEVQRMLKEGIIRPSSSPWSSPVVLVRKSDGSWRFCVDFRRVNAVTHQDAYPLPRIDATLESLSGSKFFSTLDLASGYWQVELEEADKEKTAFSTTSGHFEFNVMPFGLTNAPATFQRLMECALAGLTPLESLIHLDDIVVFSANFDDHLEQFRHNI